MELYWVIVEVKRKIFLSKRLTPLFLFLNYIKMKQELTLQNVKQSIEAMILKDDIWGLDDFMVYQDQVVDARNRLIDDFTNDFELQVRWTNEDWYIAVITSDIIVGKSWISYLTEYVLDYEFDFYIEYDPDNNDEVKDIYKEIYKTMFYYVEKYKNYKFDTM